MSGRKQLTDSQGQSGLSYCKREEQYQCFYCGVFCEPETGTNPGEGAGNVSNKQGYLGSRNILLKYLLDVRSNQNDQLLEDVVTLLKDNRKPPGELEQEDLPSPRIVVGECTQCQGEIQRIAELHQNLERTQMRIVQRLKSFRSKILQYFGQGSSSGEDQGKRGESSGMDEITGRGRLKLQKTRADFQGAVYDKGKESVDVPCVILERLAFTPNARNRYCLNGDEETAPVTGKLETDEDTNIDDHVDRFSNCRDASNPTLTRKRAASDNLSETVGAGKEPPVKRQRYRTSSTTTDATPPPRRRGTEPRPYKKRSSGTQVTRKVKRTPKEEQPPRRKMTCDLCPYSTKTTFPFEHHLRSHDAALRKEADDAQRPAPYTCDQCAKSFFCKQLDSFHRRGHQGKVTITCDVCQERLPYPEIEAHLKTHTDKIFRCGNCSFCCTVRERYLFHLRYHGKGSLECDLCANSFRTRVRLLEHLFEEHHLGEKYVCEGENCKKEFFEVSVLKAHRDVHSQSHNECSQCGKVFKSAKKLKLHHQSSHSNKRPFQCAECPESFRISANLDRHRISQHGAEKWKCPYCDKRYMDRATMKVHQTLHEGTGIPCGTCEQVLASPQLWRRHQVVHSKRLAFICEECGKGFKTRDCLKKHAAIHGGEKRYKCQFCEKAFLFPRYLADHERTHTGERPFICEICGRGFTQQGSAILHKRKCHRDPRMERNKEDLSSFGGAVPTLSSVIM